jgi:hypothetical protein
MFLWGAKHEFILWSEILTGYAQDNFGEEVLDPFCEMQRARIKSDQFIFASILQACASLENLGYGKGINNGHAYRKKNSVLCFPIKPHEITRKRAKHT